MANVESPVRYGDLTKPLDLETLLGMIDERDDPLVVKFIEISDRTQRAEMISDYKTWTDTERIAWDQGDWQTFSVLRGYSGSEIAEFATRLDLIRELDSMYGEGYSCSIEFLIKKLSGNLDL